MELRNFNEFYSGIERKGAESGVFDLLGKLLSVSLARHDVEIIIESNDLYVNKGTTLHIADSAKVEIDFEDIVELDDKLEITFSGNISNNIKKIGTFTMYFHLDWDNAVDASWKYGDKTGLIHNALFLQFGGKSKQVSDSVFKVNLYGEDLKGQQHLLGEGKGLLFFGLVHSTSIH